MTVSRHATLQAGLHANANDFTSTPSVTFIDALEDSDFQARDYKRIEKNQIQRYNYRRASVRGAKDLAPVSLNVMLKGTNIPGTGAIVQSDLEIGALLQSIFGSAISPAVSSTGSMVSSSSLSTPTVTVASGTNYAVNMPVLITTQASPLKRIARYVTNVASGVLTLDRTDGGTAVASTNVDRGVSYAVATDNPMHVPVYFSHNSTAITNEFFGCICTSAKFIFKEGEPVVLQTTWQPNDWDDTRTISLQSYTAPTTSAGHIVNVNSSFWIGNTEYVLRDAELDLGIKTAIRTAINDNGQRGVVVTGMNPVLTGKLYLEDSSGLTGGIQQAAFGSLQTGGTQDIALQIGQDKGAAMYVRMIAAEINAKQENADGLELISFTATASESVGSTNYPCRVAFY